MDFENEYENRHKQFEPEYKNDDNHLLQDLRTYKAECLVNDL